MVRYSFPEGGRVKRISARLTDYRLFASRGDYACRSSQVKRSEAFFGEKFSLFLLSARRYVEVFKKTD